MGAFEFWMMVAIFVGFGIWMIADYIDMKTADAVLAIYVVALVVAFYIGASVYYLTHPGCK